MNNTSNLLEEIYHKYVKLHSTSMKTFQKVELLTQLLLELDSINVHNDNVSRRIRKKLIDKINKHIDSIENKVLV